MIRIGRYRFLFGTIKQFKLPDLGEKIKEAVVKQWHVKIGDQVEEFQPVADVATDKMFTQIPSSYSGKVHKIFHDVEQTCQVGELFLEIETDEQKSESANISKPSENIVSKSTAQLPPTTTSINHQAASGTLASPAVRRMARERGIDLTKIQGSGKGGRVLPEDLDQSSKEAKSEKPQSYIHSQTTAQTQESEIIRMTDFQKGMQKSMTESNTIPTLYLKDEYDITHLSQLREQLKSQMKVQITFMSFFIKAFSQALLKYPIINSTYDQSKPFEFKQFKSHNISIALDSPKGLVVPNIKNCQDLSIVQIQEELNRLRQLGEKGQLSPNELSNGTICISNIGTIGGTYTGPLILPPQVCIVGLGRVQRLPRFDSKDNVVARNIMNVSFGCDHRVLDGATVTRFSNLWKQYLENPYQLLVHMK